MKRKNKVIIGAGIGLGLLGTSAMIFKTDEERKQQYMSIDLYDNIPARCDEPISCLTQVEKEKISDMIKGMDESELRIVLQNIPVELMFDEVTARLNNYTAFVSGIENAAFKYLPKWKG